MARKYKALLALLEVLAEVLRHKVLIQMEFRLLLAEAEVAAPDLRQMAALVVLGQIMVLAVVVAVPVILPAGSLAAMVVQALQVS